VQASRNQASDMGHVNEQQSTDFVRNRSELGKFDGPRIGTGTGHDHFRPGAASYFQDLVVSIKQVPSDTL
jgi:hypothetical protein